MRYFSKLPQFMKMGSWYAHLKIQISNLEHQFVYSMSCFLSVKADLQYTLDQEHPAPFTPLVFSKLQGSNHIHHLVMVILAWFTKISLNFFASFFFKIFLSQRICFSLGHAWLFDSLSSTINDDNTNNSFSPSDWLVLERTLFPFILCSGHPYPTI